MFVTAGERCWRFEPVGSQRSPVDERLRISQGLQLIAAAKALVTHVTRARVPMPKSTRELLDRLALYAAAWAPRPGRNGDGPMATLVVGGDEPRRTTDPRWRSPVRALPGGGASGRAAVRADRPS